MDPPKNTKEWILFTQGAKIGWRCVADFHPILYFVQNNSTEITFGNKSYSTFSLASTQIIVLYDVNCYTYIYNVTLKFRLLFTTVTCIFLFLYLIIFIYVNMYLFIVVVYF